MLTKKIWRTFLEYKAQFISMIIMIMIGTGIFIGFNMEWVAIERNTTDFYEETYFADYRIVNEKGLGFGEEALRSIAAIPGVEDATLYVSVDLNVKSEEQKSLAVTVTTNPKVSFFKLMSGAEYDPESPDGMWLSDQYAEANGIRLGDTITLHYNRDIPLVVKGLVKSSEYLICVPDNGSVMPSPQTYGFCYVSPAAYKSAVGLPIYPQINIRAKNLSEKEIKHLVNEALGRTTLVLTRQEVVSYHEAQGEATEGKTMGSILPVIFLLIAVLAMITTMHRVARKEKTQIGTLKALGFRDGRILRAYLSLSLIVGVIGMALGVGLGYLVCYFIMNPHGAMGTYFDMPYWRIYMPWFAYPVMAGVLLLFLLVGYLSLKEMLSGSAADTLRPDRPKKNRKILLERTPLWRRLSFGWKWNLRDMMRHKSRMLMSLIGVIGCMVILVGATGMRDTANAFIDSYYEGAMNYETRIYLDQSASKSARAAIAERYLGDTSASVAVEAGEKAVSLDIYSVSHDRIRFLGEKGDYVTLPEEGAYLCIRLAEEFDVGVGDKLTFSPFGKSEEYEVEIKGVVRSLTESILITADYADALGISYAVDSVYTAVPFAEVDAENHAIKSVKTKDEIMDSFRSFMRIMNEMILLLIVAGVVLASVVLYNLGTMGYAERYNEMATLKVVGFRDGKISALLIGQTMLVTLIGMVLGLPAGVGVLKWLIAALASEYEMKLALGPLTYLVSLILTAGVSLTVGLLVARQNKKIDPVAALKSPE